MAAAEGFVRRITRRLLESPEDRDAVELSGEAASTGAISRTSESETSVPRSPSEPNRLRTW